MAALGNPIIRDPNTIYLSDFGEKMRASLTQPTNCWMDQEMTRPGGTLKFPQSLEIIALGPNNMLRIRGTAQQGGVAAWIPLSSVTGLPLDFAQNLAKAEARRIQVENLIAQNEVAIAMTKAEVERSLGRPQKKRKQASSNNVSETWEYIRYKLIPQTIYQGGTGFPLCQAGPQGALFSYPSGWNSTTVYLKIPDGSLKIEFQNELVSSLDQTEGEPTPGRIKIVVPAIEVNLS